MPVEIRNNQKIPAIEQIVTAENQRKAGNTLAATVAMKPAVEFRLRASFPPSTRQEEKRILMGSRIYIDGKISQASRQKEAPVVAAELAEVRQAIIDVYRDPYLQTKIPQYTTDALDRPYDFATETARDEIKYTLTLFALTGNFFILQSAIDQFNIAIAHATVPASKTLVQFEQARVRQQAESSRGSFRNLKDTYRQSTQASEAIQNWERVTTIAARYGIDAAKSGYFLEAAKGAGVCIKTGVKHIVAAFKEQGTVKKRFQDAKSNASTVTILLREIAKARKETKRNQKWKETTPQNTDYSSLVLPSKELTPPVDTEIRDQYSQIVEFAEEILLGKYDWDIKYEDSFDPAETFHGPILDLNWLQTGALNEVEKQLMENWIETKLGTKPEEALVQRKLESPDGETRVTIYDAPLGLETDRYFISRWQNTGKEPSFILWQEEMYELIVEESGFIDVM